MANVIERNGNRTVGIYLANGERKWVALGDVAQGTALDFGRNVDGIVAALAAGGTPGKPLALWLDSLSDLIHAKLADLGLCQRRATDTLREWLDSIMAEKRQELKPGGSGGQGHHATGGDGGEVKGI